MNGRRKSLAVAVLGLAAMAAVFGFPQSRSTETATAAGSAPVTVVNTPLPVSLQGTGTVTGKVTALQGGSWSVGVTTLPAVQLAPGTTVNVQGGGANDSAREAYSLSLCATGDTESCGVNPTTATIPLNKRFVIEFVSGYCFVRNTGIHGWTLTAPLNGQSYEHMIGDKISAHDDDSTTGLFTNQTRIYADGGQVDSLSVRVLAQGFSEHHDYGPEAYCNATLSGYLVDTTPPFPAAR